MTLSDILQGHSPIASLLNAISRACVLLLTKFQLT